MTSPFPRSVALATLATLAVAGLCGCRGGPTARGAATSADPAAAPEHTGGREPSLLPRTANDAAGERYFRVDSLVAQWDAAQADGRDEESALLAKKAGEEVDADFALFASASKGEQGLRAQSLAVKALAFSSRPDATTLLVARLGDSDPDLVANALIGLKVRADPATPLPPILRLLRSPTTSHRRFAPLALATVVLARERVGRSIEPDFSRQAASGLVGLVQDRDPIVRLHAAKAMGALRRPEATDFLVLLLRDEHARIRVAAAAALERVGDPRAFPKVVELLEASDDATKPLVRDVLVSYAGHLQGSPLSPQQVAEFGVSPHAWNRWFASRAGAPPPGAPAPGVPSPGAESPSVVAPPSPPPPGPAEPAPAQPAPAQPAVQSQPPPRR